MPLIIESECDTINPEKEGPIPEQKVLLVSRDLNARARVEAAAAPGVDVSTAPTLGDVAAAIDLVLLDLDAGGREMLDRVATLSRALPEVRWVGFFSHIDEELGRVAGEAGVQAIPRGRFWGQLGELLSGS